LIATLIFSQAAVWAQEPSVDVVYPFLEADNQTLLLNPYMHDSFLGYLNNQSVYPIIGEEGFPLFYYSANETFGCDGVCSNITMNNYVFGSEMMNITPGPGMDVLDESVILGSSEIEEFMDIVNSIRTTLADDPDALAEFEKQLLEDQEDMLRSAYFENAYDDVFEYAVEELKKDPETYDSLRRDIVMNDLDSAVEELERYLAENFDIDEAYDLSNLYSALEDKKIGQIQLEEYLNNVLDKMAEMENVDLNTDDIEKFSELMNSEEFKKAADKATDMLEDNPEAFEELLELAERGLESPEAREMFKDAVKEMLERADWESIQKLMDLFNKMDNKQQLLETLMEGFSEHMREMVQEGKIDELKGMLDDPKVREMMLEAAQSFSQTSLEMLADWTKEIPIEFAYIIALAATIATLIILYKIKI
jgi:tetratricopeptide (TPR) repeat protein